MSKASIIQKKINEKHSTQEVGQPGINLEKYKKLAKMVGAFQKSEVDVCYNRIMQCRMLEEAKNNDRFRDMGYNSFPEFCKNELGMSHTNAYQILKDRKKLGAMACDNLINLGLRLKDLKILANPAIDVQIDNDENTITFDDETKVEIKKDNIDLIQSAVEKLKMEIKKAKKEAENTKKEKDKIEIRYTELEKKVNWKGEVIYQEYSTELNKYQLQIKSSLDKLKELKKTKGKDKEKNKAFIVSVHAINSLMMQTIDELLEDEAEESEEM